MKDKRAMWWGHHSSSRRGNGAFWVIIFIAIGVAVMSGRGWGWGWWLLFPLFFFILPMLWRYMNHDSDDGGGGEKRKNEADESEKPKRYVTSEDGEPLEVIEEDAPPRRRDPDDIEYV